MKNLLIGVIGVIGVIGSIREYQNWKREETANYGQGWEQTKVLKESETLVGPYINEKQGFRIRYPKNWLVREDKTSTAFYLDNKSIQIKQISTNLNFPDYVDSLASGVIRDRDYVESWVILTFEGSQKALTQKSNKIYLITAATPAKNWNEYELTFKEVYKSLVIF
ncbi:hypothetical protein HZB69_03790 [Candidatus Amesbacteria bacterium]|nr:hypothetical protein [Candidatus Amesbacteria bacterium]